MNRAVICLLIGLVGTAGCGRLASPPAGDVQDLVGQTTSATAPDAAGLSDKELTQLRAELDDVIQRVRDGRQLNTVDHAAWQVLHGILAYGKEFKIQVGTSGEAVPALDYLLQGGTLTGWVWQPGETLPDGRTGLRAILEPGTKSGQGHMDQWFAYMSQAGLTPDQKILVGGREYQLSDVIQQAQLDLPRNVEREYSWTVAGLTTYLPTNSSWPASDGKTWSIEQMLSSEVEQDLTTSACGGTHRMVSLAMALQQHVAQHGEVSGVWSRVHAKIQDCLRRAREYQQPNGAFSSNYFDRPGVSADLAQMLGSTGHAFEFVAMSASESELRAPWVARAAQYLCGLLRKTMDRQLECGALYHATHGLVIYRQRLESTASAPAQAPLAASSPPTASRSAP